MAGILKNTGPARCVHGVAFNFEDLTQQANGYLDKVRAEAARIIAEAQRQAAAIRQQAEQAGRAAALAQMERTAEQKVAAQMQTVLPALRQAIGQVEEARRGWLKHWEARAVHVAAAIAERVIRRELQQSPQIALVLIREALELAAGSPRIRLLLNPEDQQALGKQVGTLVAEMAGLANTEIVGTVEIRRGECRVDTQFGSIDQQIAAQLARIEEELV